MMITLCYEIIDYRYIEFEYLHEFMNIIIIIIADD